MSERLDKPRLRDEGTAGGVLRDLIFYRIDLLRHLLDQPFRFAYGRAASRRMRSDSSSRTALMGPQGVVILTKSGSRRSSTVT